MVRYGKEFYDPGHSDKYLSLVILGEGSWSQEEHNGPYKKLEISTFPSPYCKYYYSDRRRQSEGLLLVIKFNYTDSENTTSIRDIMLRDYSTFPT
jgi:hypothetical protein